MVPACSDQPIPQWPRKLQAANGVVKEEGIANGDTVMLNLSFASDPSLLYDLCPRQPDALYDPLHSMLQEALESGQQMQGKRGSGKNKLLHKVDSDDDDNEDMQQAL